MDEVSIKRIHWQCRRGVLELDTILLAFYKKVFPSLSDEEKELFSQLLGYTDPELLAWLLEAKPCPVADLHALIAHIQAQS